MPRKKKKKRKISVSPPPKRREAKLLKDTTGVERLAVFKVSRGIGRLLSGLIIGVGLLLFVFSLHILVTTTQLSVPWLKSFFDNVLGFLDIGIFFTDQVKGLTKVLLGFFGVLNTLCGLLLLTKE